MALRAVSLPQTEQPQGGAQLGDIPSGLLGFFSATDPTISGLRPQFGTTSRFSNGPGGVGVRADGLSTGYVSLAKNLSPPGYTGTFFGLFRLLAGTDSILLSTNNSVGEYTGHTFYCLSGGSVGVLMGAGGGTSSGERRSLDSPSGTFTAGQLVAVAFAVDSSTTGRVWVNGKQYSLTASGSGGAYAGGSSAGGIGVQRVTSYSAADVLAVGMWAPSLPNEVLQRWTTDPFGSLFAPSQLVVPVSAGGSSVSLIVADATHGHTADGLVLTSSTALSVAEAAHAHAADAITLVVGSVLTVSEASHAHAADSLTLTAASALAVADATHSHAADNITLSIAGATNLTVADALHGHAADALALTSAHALIVADATHGHAVDGLTLTAASVLAIQEALHAHAADNVTLDASGAVNLLLADSLHAHTADGVALTVAAWLTVADALHGHSADNVVLTFAGPTVLSAPPLGHGPAAARRIKSAGRSRAAQLSTRTR